MTEQLQQGSSCTKCPTISEGLPTQAIEVAINPREGGLGHLWAIVLSCIVLFPLRFRVTHIEKRYGLHEHRDGSPTDRSWGSGGGQEPGASQVAAGGQPRTGTTATERLLPEPPPSQAVATHPVQNGGLKDDNLVPRTLEGAPGTSAELNLGTRGRGPSSELLSQEANGQPTKLDTSGQQV